eukprot:scaffold25059_cov215-Cylindrotheca_fusiformis.AAC.2
MTGQPLFWKRSRRGLAGCSKLVALWMFPVPLRVRKRWWIDGCRRSKFESCITSLPKRSSKSRGRFCGLLEVVSCVVGGGRLGGVGRVLWACVGEGNV